MATFVGHNTISRAEHCAYFHVRTDFALLRMTGQNFLPHDGTPPYKIRDAIDSILFESSIPNNITSVLAAN